MSHSLSPQHPAVVLRSHYVHLRALLAIAMIAVVGLTVAVVILATRDAGSTSPNSAARVSTPAPAAPGQRYDGGPEEGTRGLAPSNSTPSAAIRYDGGPEEGSSRIQPSSAAPSPSAAIRYDGGPEEGGSGLAPSNSTPSAGIRYDGGPEEGSSGIQPSSAAPSPSAGIRYDGGPEEGTSGLPR